MSPWLWGAVLTCGVYGAINVLPVGRDLAQRYFCNHPLEYALAALFCVGLAIILAKTLTNRWEWSAFRKARQLPIDSNEVPYAERLDLLKSHASQFTTNLHETYWGHRLGHLWSFLSGKPRADGIADHLNYLSESSLDRLHASYSLMNTIIWAIPIVGFLGTVMGITLAIANITPDQLETSMGAVTGGLAVAFDTTAVALTWSLVLGFASLFVKRTEEQLLAEIDEQTRVEVNRCFPAEQAESPLLLAQSDAARRVIQETDELVRQQRDLWQTAVDAFRSDWFETLQRQQAELGTSLSNATASAAGSHAQQLREFRDEFVTAYQAVSASLGAELRQLETGRALFSDRLSATLETFDDRLRSGLEQQLEQQRQANEQTTEQVVGQLTRLEDAITQWQSQFAELSAASREHAQELRSQTDLLSQLVGQKSELAELQLRLTDNLQAVRSAETFDETLHNLTAAVHLLTARARAA
ncbi:MAG: MotA/TolQ/ExbB proton channel family protein [Planctomycetaceae bacterium]|nr:MotA/TolQ/ExbB proton channel family protein [Planctomycetaceae bacterium]